MSLLQQNIAIVDIGFSLLIKGTQVLINECSISLVNEITPQTFHIKCGSKTLEKVKEQHHFQLNFNKNKFHKIPLHYGSLKYVDFCDIFVERMVQDGINVVLVKGRQKKDFVKDILAG